MREAFWILGILLKSTIAAAPWSSIYDFFWKERNKKYKSREDVIWSEHGRRRPRREKQVPHR